MSNSFYLRVEDKEGSSALVYTQSYRAIKRERKKKKKTNLGEGNMICGYFVSEK